MKFHTLSDASMFIRNKACVWLCVQGGGIPTRDEATILFFSNLA